MLNRISKQDIETYQTQGVVVLRDVFTPWIELLSQGAAFNITNPSTRALTHGNDQSRFLEDFCCWKDIPEYSQFVTESPLASIAAKLMHSNSAQFFHDHFLYKEGGSNIPTPWHQDMPYYCVDGEQTVSFWIPLERRAKAISLKCLAGSH
ncbi:MAG: phytanoyl-CoA dioxygenase family protein, partial [Algicola sp.]|nr:phytanoyl-CoA dioxygenase family protein [Algicola sp.]